MNYMYNSINELHDILYKKKEQLAVSKEKREQHIKDLTSQQQAVESLEYYIGELDKELKQLEDLAYLQNREYGKTESGSGCVMQSESSKSELKDYNKTKSNG